MVDLKLWIMFTSSASILSFVFPHCALWVLNNEKGPPSIHVRDLFQLHLQHHCTVVGMDRSQDVQVHCTTSLQLPGQLLPAVEAVNHMVLGRNPSHLYMSAHHCIFGHNLGSVVISCISPFLELPELLHEPTRRELVELQIAKKTTVGLMTYSWS